LVAAALSLVEALAALSLSFGALPAESACNAMPSAAMTASAVRSRVGPGTIKLWSLLPSGSLSDIYSFDKIDEELTGQVLRPLSPTTAKRRQ
jgi:hypothetical protein